MSIKKFKFSKDKTLAILGAIVMISKCAIDVMNSFGDNKKKKDG